MLKNKNKKTGFTLIELMVSVSIFSLIMVIAMGSILSVLDANRKSQSLRGVMDNVNYTLESMTRTIRFSTNYHCGGGDVSVPADCGGGANSITVLNSDGQKVTFALSGDTITRFVDGDAAPIALTAPDVTINTLTFKVYGSAPSPDTFQPFVIIVAKGTVLGKNGTGSTFTLQTSISQRTHDI